MNPAGGLGRKKESESKKNVLPGEKAQTEKAGPLLEKSDAHRRPGRRQVGCKLDEQKMEDQWTKVQK